MSRLLLITRNFPPLVGGMERLAQHMYQQLKVSYTVDLVGPKGCKKYTSGPGLISESRVSPLPVFLVDSFIKAFWLAFRNRPDIIVSGSGLTTPTAVLVGRAIGSPSVACLHGLDLVVKNRLYQHLFIPFIRYADRVIVNSHNTARLAAEAGIKQERIEVIHPGVDTAYAKGEVLQFKTLFNLEKKKLLLSVGRLIPRKGLAEFIHHVLPGIVTRYPETVLVVIGDQPEYALKKARSTLDDIEDAIKHTHLEAHVRLLGRVDDETLNAAYNESDLCIFPLIEIPGDVEGFGMVAIEAAAHGLPTIAFAVGGVIDAISDGRSGVLIKPGKYDSMTRACIAYFEGSFQNINETACRKFAAEFDWQLYGSRLRATLEKACQSIKAH